MDDEAEPAIIAKRAKRTGTIWPTSLSSSSCRYSQATSVSSLPLAVAAQAELVGQLLEGERPRRGGEEIDQDLKPWAGRGCARRPSKADRRIMKNPLIGSLSSALTTSRLRRVARLLNAGARFAPNRRHRRRRRNGCDDDIELLAFERVEHARQQGLVMLKIGVHDGEERGRAGEGPLDARRRQAAPAETLHAANIRLDAADGADMLGRAVARIVVETKMASQAMPASTASSRAISGSTLPRSLKVGRTTVSSTGTGRCVSRSAPGIGAISCRLIGKLGTPSRCDRLAKRRLRRVPAGCLALDLASRRRCDKRKRRAAKIGR